MRLDGISGWYVTSRAHLPTSPRFARHCDARVSHRAQGAPEPDDFELYLLLAASEYVLQTKDLAFLSERFCSFNSSEPRPVIAHLLRATAFVLDIVGVGPHGLLRLLSSDWDDGFKPPPAERNLSESVLSSALAAYVLPRWAAVLRMAGGHDENATRVERFAESLKQQMLGAAWDPAGWLRRAWLGPTGGWVGSSDAADSDGGVFSATAGGARAASLSHSMQCIKQAQESHSMA